MPLTSELFKNNKQLQKCLISDPDHIVANEPPIRRGVNDKGEHVALIHKALRQVMPNVSFGLEEATETYGPKTAEVVRQFKAMQDPPILNKSLQQKVPDNIVGKLTIAALDREVQKKKPPPPVVPKPPSFKPAVEQRQIFKKTFEEKFFTRNNAQDDPTFLAIGELINQTIKDIPRMLSNPIEGSDFDDGEVKLRRNLPVPVSHVMKVVNIEKEVRRLPNIVGFGTFTMVLNITREYSYSYGVGQQTDRVTVNTTATLLNLFPGQPRNVVKSTRTVDQPSSLLDPR
jgi:hypothetical protein